MLTILLIIVPLFFSLVVFGLKHPFRARAVALAGSLLNLAIATGALFQFIYTCSCNLDFEAVWSSSLGTSLSFGIDRVSIWLVMLTAFLVPIIILSTFGRKFPRTGLFYGLILLMETALLGVFTTRDALLFYIFWELALIPAWFICALWGSGDRIRITFKFFAYTFTGSLLMLAALLFIYLKTPVPHSFEFGRMYEAMLTPGQRSWIFAGLFLAMAVKIPIFPFHTWQPDTYTAAPAAGSMLLGGIMLKMGLYGLIRLVVPFAGPSLADWADPVIILSITGIIYASLIAVTRDDLKRLLAYSSIAHVGLIAAGLTTVSEMVLGGGIIQMVAHGINLTGLFILTDYIERRTGTRSISALGGIAIRAPRLAILFMILLLGSIALPLTNGFPGEFILLTGLFGYQKVYALLAGLTVILSAIYMLWMYQRVFLGSPNTLTDGFTDLTPMEMITVVPLAVMVLVIGWYPNLILNVIAPH